MCLEYVSKEKWDTHRERKRDSYVQNVRASGGFNLCCEMVDSLLALIQVPNKEENEAEEYPKFRKVCSMENPKVTDQLNKDEITIKMEAMGLSSMNSPRHINEEMELVDSHDRQTPGGDEVNKTITS